MEAREKPLDEIFGRAIEQATPEARAEYLDRACGDDADLRRRIEELVAAYERMGPYLERGEDPLADEVGRALGLTVGAPDPGADPSPDAADAAERPGAVIGRYKLLQLLGEGGFGTVHMAEQLEPVRRRVALKLIKAGMDTRSVIARFEAERQALAMMEHPNIARALDAGSTENGRPYFVMELVRGIPITQYCDEAKLSIPERLELFSKVCDAVQHAHQKGIIHRDLKPGNVLVTLHDGVPVPKVIDFGIAKAIDQRLTEKTLFTEFRQMVGTPEYMAPEQAEMSGLDVDTRADIYSLGVLLYELLTGKKPFEMKDLLAIGFQEVIRTIREVDPPKPSTRVSTLGNELRGVADRRHTEPRSLGACMRGDLDWIAMKALEKDRGRRYQTARELAQDVGRYLRDESVLATPPSAAYRLRKFVRRHRIGVAASLLVAIAIGAGLGVATSGLIRARSEARRAAAVQRIVLDLLAAPDPDQFRGPEYSVRDLIDEFEWRLGDSISAEPAIEASVRTTLGGTLINLGLLERAEAQIDRALAAGRAAWDGDHEVLADTLRYRGGVLRELGRAEPAIAAHLEGIAMRRRLHGDTHRELARDLVVAAHTQWESARFDDAMASLEEARAIQRRLFGPRHEDVADSTSWIGYVHELTGDIDAASRHYEDARAIYESALEPGDPRSAHVLGLLSRVARMRGDFDRAVALARESLARLRESLGDDSPETVVALRELAMSLDARGEYEPAQASALEAVELCRATYGDDALRTGFARSLLGKCLVEQGRSAEGRAHLIAAIDVLERRAPASMELAVAVNALGLAAMNEQRYAAAGEHFERAISVLLRNHAADHPQIAIQKGNLAFVYSETGRLPEAERLLREAIEVQREDFGDASPVVVSNLSGLGQIVRRQGRVDEARAITREALEIARARFPGHPVLANVAGNLATLVEDPEERLRLTREAVECLEVAVDPGHESLLRFRANLAFVLGQAERFEESADEFAQVVPMARCFAGHPDPILRYQHQAAIAFERACRWEDLESAARDLLAYRREFTPEDEAGLREAQRFIDTAIERRGETAENETPRPDPEEER